MLSTPLIHWIAGFLEGEGCFALAGNGGITVSASQVQREPLERLQASLGGSLRQYSNVRCGQPYWRWNAHGSRAAGVMMTVYGLMSPRRRVQIARVIAFWRSRPGTGSVPRGRTHCPSGHPYDAENTYRHPETGERRCRICAVVTKRNMRARHKTAALS